MRLAWKEPTFVDIHPNNGGDNYQETWNGEEAFEFDKIEQHPTEEDLLLLTVSGDEATVITSKNSFEFL